MGHTTDLQNELRRLSEGCLESRNIIVELCCERLRIITRRMLGNYGHVKRWTDTDDVLQASLLRLYQALFSVKPESVRKFYGLASTQIRRELIDLARSYYGEMGLGTNHCDCEIAVENYADPFEPNSIFEWAKFHQAIEELPPVEKEVISLLWYDGISKQECARILGISNSTLKRRLVSIRLLLQEKFQGGLDLD